MPTFIRVIEVWKLSRRNAHLELEAGMYGDLDEFRWESERTGFRLGEGLPGRAWAEQRPILLTDLREPYFRRAGGARRAELRAAVAIPVFVGEFLSGVVTMLCAEGFVGGAVEVWSQRESPALRLEDGYYGALHSLRDNSKALTFAPGEGLPGTALERREPVLASPLAVAPAFVRNQLPGEVEVTTGIAWPVATPAGTRSVVVFLSAPHTPIASSFELWRPNRGALELSEGHEGDEAYYADLRAVDIKRAEGFLGRACVSGCPMLCEDLGRDDSRYAHWASAHGLRTACAIPFNDAGRLKAVLVLAM